MPAVQLNQGFFEVALTVAASGSVRMRDLEETSGFTAVDAVDAADIIDDARRHAAETYFAVLKNRVRQAKSG